MTTLLLDTHVVHWWSAQPARSSDAAREAIAAAAVALPSSFAGGPADRLIYAIAIERGLRLVTKDGRLRAYVSPRPVAVW